MTVDYTAMWYLLCVAARIAAAADVPVQPHTYIEVATHWEHGQAKEEYRMLRAVNSSGASVTQDLSTEAGGLRQILDNGVQTLVDPVRRSAVSSAGRPRVQPAMPGACSERFRFWKQDQLEIRPGGDRLAGLVVDRISLRRGTRRSEWWLAPALDCAMLRDETYEGNRLVRRTEATAIRLGEPDPKVFEIPADYTYTRVTPNVK